jgi:hypothetical protein
MPCYVSEDRVAGVSDDLMFKKNFLHSKKFSEGVLKIHRKMHIQLIHRSIEYLVSNFALRIIHIPIN